ncbi:MAG: O-antigen ligase family protein [Planctomycetota bacterium]
MKLTRAAFLLLPLAGILAVDPVPFDFHAVKFVVLAVVALVALGGAVAAGLFAWTNLSLPLWLFVAVRGVELLRAPPSGRALRWWGLLLTLTVVHHVVAAAAPRAWLNRRMIPMLGGLGAAVAVFAVVQRFTDARQAHAFFANRNFAGAGLAMLLPYALAWGKKSPVFAIAIGLLATGSRGGMLAAAVAGAWWAAQRLPRYRWLFLAGVPALVLAAGFWLGERNTIKVRGHWYRAAVDLGVERPLLGHGADGFAREYPPVRPREEYAISGGRVVHAVHNDYLEAWANGGLLGLGVLLFLIVMVLGAARASEPVFASWLAFSAAAFVDLPWHDPGLLTLAFAGLSLVAERRVLTAWARPVAAVGCAAVLCILPAALGHWVADRKFGRYLTSGEGLDAVLRWERRHPGALIERSRADDLELLLESEPHHAGAWHNQSRLVGDDEAIAMLRTVLRDHDPHHSLTRVRLARLLLDRGEKAQAMAVLEEAIESDPRPVAPFVLMARILRESGNLERAEYWIDRVPPAAFTRALLREKLEIELGNLREDRWDARTMDYLVRSLPPDLIQERIATALARGDAIVAARPAPKVPRRDGETADEHLVRVQESRAEYRRTLRAETKVDYREAFLLAEALCRHRPTVARLRQKAAAARGLGDVERAGHFESQALFLEVLGSLANGDPVTARRKFKRARQAYPGLTKEPEVVVAVKVFAGTHPGRVELARELFAEHPGLIKALDR